MPGLDAGQCDRARLPAVVPAPGPPGALGRREVPEVMETKNGASRLGQAGRARRGPGRRGARGCRLGSGPHPREPGRLRVPTAWPGASRCPFRRPAGVRRVKAAGRPSPSQSPGRGARAPGRAGAGPDVRGRSEPAGPALTPHGAPAERSPGAQRAGPGPARWGGRAPRRRCCYWSDWRCWVRRGQRRTATSACTHPTSIWPREPASPPRPPAERRPRRAALHAPPRTSTASWWGARWPAGTPTRPSR